MKFLLETASSKAYVLEKVVDTLTKQNTDLKTMPSNLPSSYKDSVRCSAENSAERLICSKQSMTHTHSVSFDLTITPD